MAMKEDFLNELLSDLISDIVFEAHKWNKVRNSICQVCHSRCQSFVIMPAVDIYGQPRDANTEKHDCPSCDIGYPACRFAPHLEKCMGLGRRIGRRITASTSLERFPSPSRISEDDEEEFLIQPMDRKKKPKSAKKIKIEKDIPQSDLLLGDLVFDNQSLWGPMGDTADDDFTSTFMGLDESKEILFENVSL